MLLDSATVIGHPSPWVILMLLAMLAASVVIFALLARRETSHRRRLAIADWAALHGLRVQRCDRAGEMLAPLAEFKPQARWLIGSDTTAAAQLRLQGKSAAPSAPTDPSPRWHVLLRRLESPWKPTALRPTVHSSSLCDLFPLSSFPSLSSGQRFMVFGAASTEAARLARSPAPALLPPDVGLMLHGPWLVLDFSTRQFDEIELDRMVDLAEQLAPRLNAAAAEF